MARSCPLVLVVALAGMGCVPDFGSSTQGRPCKAGLCPDGFVCIDNVCVAPPAGADASTDGGGMSALGETCTGTGQCSSGFCTDGVCCDSACNDKVCQRCDRLSAGGAGHCGFAKADTDPDHECAPAILTCSEKCRASKATASCSGSGYGCASKQESVLVPSGEVCVAGAIVQVSSAAFCNSGNDCAEGSCKASRWWTGCDGAGSCRASTDMKDALVEVVTASAGATLKSGCATSGATPCDATPRCVGHTQYSGRSCDSSQACTVDTGKIGCCGCAGFACDPATYTCKTGCVGDGDCASGYSCLASACAVLSGTGEACTGSGQGSCQRNLKCDSGICCAASGNRCCDASHACAEGLACNEKTFQCAASCTKDTQTGCASSNTYCSDGAHCVAKKGLAIACTSAEQCASGFCADGVCCDAACKDKLCQRCDGLSAGGAGHCGFAAAASDPDHDCPAPSKVCSGSCALKTTTSACNGTGYACSAKDETSPVPSGQICSDGSVAPVTKSINCGTASDCEGKCRGFRWWTSCDGNGTCRSPNDTKDALAEVVTAAPGASLTSTCATNGATLCDANSHCVGHTVYAGHLCDGSGLCTMDATKIGCCGCGNYACDAATFTCKAQCAVNGDCAPGLLCTAQSCHPDYEWAQWRTPQEFPADYDTTANDTVTDKVTGLVWQRAVPTQKYSWAEAATHCLQLGLGGYTSGWRLPTVMELHSLFYAQGLNQVAPAIREAAFPNTPPGEFWTASSLASNADAGWFVDFHFGGSGHGAKSDTRSVRCVR